MNESKNEKLKGRLVRNGNTFDSWVWSFGNTWSGLAIASCIFGGGGVFQVLDDSDENQAAQSISRVAACISCVIGRQWDIRRLEVVVVVVFYIP
jgi:hypothetical protein